MNNIEELKKVLDFYVGANTLKTKIYDEINNFSISDSLYGAISLAIAMDSEFNESYNVSRVIKMMILDEFQKANPNYNFEKLKNGKELQSLINEARSLETIDSKLAFKYRMMDFVLTNLIYVRGKNQIESKVIEESIKCFNPQTNEEYNKYREVVKYYIYNSRLKDKQRSGWDKNHWNIKTDRIERVSEHIVSTILLAIVMDSEMNYSKEKLDRNIILDDVIKTLSIHEIGETLIGDITPFDGITPEQKQEMEHKAMSDVLGNLTQKNELLEILDNFDDKKTNEGIFAYLCDKMEADLQSKYYQDTFQHRSLNDQETNKVINLPITKKLIEEGAKTPFDIWYGYDKNIFEKYSQYEEFQDLLKLIRDNNMFRRKMDPVITNIKLTEEEHEFLSSQISEFLEYATKDNNVEAVTQRNIVDGNKGTIIIDLCITDEAFYQRYMVELDNMTEQFKKINKTGIEVLFRFESMANYNPLVFGSHCQIFKEILSVSEILLDKTGRLTNIKNDNTEELTRPFHTIKYIPPVEEEIKRRLIIK